MVTDMPLAACARMETPIEVVSVARLQKEEEAVRLRATGALECDTKTREAANHPDPPPAPLPPPKPVTDLDPEEEPEMYAAAMQAALAERDERVSVARGVWHTRG